MQRAARSTRCALAGLVAVAASACASQPVAGSGASAPSTAVPPAPLSSAPAASTSSAPSQVPPTTRSSASTAPPGPSGQAKAITVRGRVVVGIVPDCLQLVTDTSQFTLVGTGLQGFGTGDRVEVEGVPAAPGEAACGGAALRVRKIRRV